MTEYTNLIANSEFAGAVLGSFKRAAAPIASATPSNLGLTLTSTSATNSRSRGLAWIVAGRGDGKVWYRVTYNVLASTGASGGVGFTNLVTSNDNGSNTTTLFVRQSDAAVRFNNATLGSIKSGALAAGDVIDLIIDEAAGLFWGRVNGGLWNLSATANPTTGVDGLAHSLTGSTIYAYARHTASGEQVTFDFDGAPPSGCSRFPVGSVPRWAAAMDAIASIELSAAAVTNGVSQISLTFRLLVDNTTGAAAVAQLRADQQPCLPSTAYAHIHGAATVSAATNATRQAGFETFTDGAGAGASGLQAVVAPGMNTGNGGAATTGATAAFIQFVTGASWSTSGVVANVTSWTIGLTQLLQVASTSLASYNNIPHIPTTDGPVTMDWRTFSAIGAGSVTRGGGGPNDPPAYAAKVAVEVIGPGSPGGQPTSTAGAGAGAAGLYSRAHAVDLAPGETLSWTIAAKVTAADSAAAALQVLRGATVVCAADGGGAASGITGAAAGQTANSVGDVKRGGGAGGNGFSNGTAGGGGACAPGPNRYVDNLTGGNATTTNGAGAGSFPFGAFANRISGGNAGVAGTNALDPGGAANGAGSGGASVGSGSRGEVWIGWVVSTGGVTYTQGVAGAASALAVAQRTAARSLLVSAASIAALRSAIGRFVRSATTPAGSERTAAARALLASTTPAPTDRAAIGRILRVAGGGEASARLSTNRLLRAASAPQTSLASRRVALLTLLGGTTPAPAAAPMRAAGRVLQAAAGVVTRLRLAAARDLAAQAGPVPSLRRLPGLRLQAVTDGAGALRRAYAKSLRTHAGVVAACLAAVGSFVGLIARLARGRRSGGEIFGRASGGAAQGRGPMGEKRNWTFDAGEDWIIRLTCCQADGETPLDLTGGNVKLRFLSGDGGPIDVTGQIEDALGGVVLLVVAPAAQGIIADDVTFTYTVRATLQDGTVSDQLFGTLRVRKSEF